MIPSFPVLSPVDHNKVDNTYSIKVFSEADMLTKWTSDPQTWATLASHTFQAVPRGTGWVAVVWSQTEEPIFVKPGLTSHEAALLTCQQYFCLAATRLLQDLMERLESMPRAIDVETRVLEVA